MAPPPSQRQRPTRGGGARGPIVDRGESGCAVVGGQAVVFPIRRSRRRSIGLTIDGNGLRITAPHRATMAEILDVVAQKERWILRTFARIEDRHRQVFQRRYTAGEVFHFLGRELTLEIRIGESPQPSYPVSLPPVHGQLALPFEVLLAPAPRHPLRGVFVEGDRLVVAVKDARAATPQAIRTLLRHWYEAQAEALIPDRVRHYAALLDRPVTRIRISDAKHRWGSCSAKGSIRMSWRLAMAPPELIDYVAAHEACHLVHQHHRPRFWQAVERLVPDWRERRKTLSQRGSAYELPEPQP